MNARTSLPIPAYGEQLEGGLFYGIVLLDGKIWGEVAAPKALELQGPWHTKSTDVKLATSDFDGLANTIAMAKAGSAIAKQIREIEHDGFSNYYLAARGGQLQQWANLRPLLPETEAFEPAYYWNSTQFSRYHAFGQGFGSGYTDNDDKSWEGGRWRLARRFLIG